MNQSHLHPSQQTAYITSYPRSGKSWFMYCLEHLFKLSENKSSLIHHTHYITPHQGSEYFNISNTFDIKHILLLRNYKEAIVSHLKQVLSHINPMFIILEVAFALDNKNGCTHPVSPDDVAERLSPLFPIKSSTKTDFEIGLSRIDRGNFEVERFLLPEYPVFSSNIQMRTNPEIPIQDEWCFPLSYYNKNSITLSQLIRTNSIFHYYLAVQLYNYYKLIEYHDKVAQKNLSNTLIIRYEQLIQEPTATLSRVIDFLQRNNLISKSVVSSSRTSLKYFIDKITQHRVDSLNGYRSSGHLAESYSDNGDLLFHSKGCDKSFLSSLSHVLEKRNPKLFKKYLLDYEE